MESSSANELRDINNLIDIAIHHGFPDTQHSQVFLGTLIVARKISNIVSDRQSTPDFPVQHGYASTTRDPQGSRADDSNQYVYLRYQGPARQLCDGQWLMGESELITPGPDVTVDTTNATLYVPDHTKNEPEFPSTALLEAGNMANEHGNLFEPYENLIFAAGSAIGGESSAILQRFSQAFKDHSDVPGFPRDSLLYRLRAGEQFSDNIWMVLGDLDRLGNLSTQLGYNDRPLVLDALDIMPIASGGNSDPGFHDAQDHESEKLSHIIASNNNPWSKINSPSLIVKRTLLRWFTHEIATGQSSDQDSAQAAIFALGGKSSDVPTIPLKPINPQEIDTKQIANADVVTRLQMGNPNPLHWISTDKTIYFQRGTPEKQYIGSAIAWDDAVFYTSELGELIKLLEDERPTHWRNAQGSFHPVGDAALRAIAGILTFDPRHLFGLQVASPWNQEERRRVAKALSDWHTATGHMPLSDALAQAALALSPTQAATVLMVAPPAAQSAILHQLSEQWMDPKRRPDLQHMQTIQVAHFISILLQSSEGQLVLPLFDLSSQPALLRAILDERKSSTNSLDDLLLETIHSPSRTTTEDKLLHRQLVVAANAFPTPQRAKMLCEVLLQSLADPATQNVLMQSLFPSNWIGNLDALIPGVQRNANGLFKFQRTEPTYLSWFLWSIAIEDPRPLPPEIKSALSLNEQRFLYIKHDGAEVSVPLDISFEEKPTFNKIHLKTTLADDLRVCDLAGWALAAQETGYFCSKDAQNVITVPCVDLTEPLSKREPLVISMRKMILKLTAQNTQPPLSPPLNNHYIFQ